MSARSSHAEGDARERPLRVGLNLLFMGEQAGGAGRYALELPAALLAADPRTEVHVFISRLAPAELRQAPWADAVRWVELPISSGSSRLALPVEFALLPALARIRGLEVLHSPANTGPVITPGVAAIVSLLDLIWLHRGGEWEASARARRQMALLVRHCVRHAAGIFAISHAAAEDLVRTLGVAPERVHVTPLGVHVGARSTPGEQAQLRERLQLTGARVLLCVAQKRPYKNLARLLHALPELEDDLVLVLAGPSSAHEEELRELARQLGIDARVRFVPWLSDRDLNALYALSDLFVLPSLIEGFGIPVLEAMAAGTPVACSRAPALPEVAGDAALLFDPESQAELTGALRRLLEDRELARRLIARGQERVRRFSWLQTGARSLEGYRRAVERQRSRRL
jgi:glycosyltransferase involved in cell wall biosynthesis